MEPLSVNIPSECRRVTNSIFLGVVVNIQGHDIPADLINFNLGDLDVILGMDWLGKHHGIVDCRNQKVRLRGPKGQRISYQNTIVEKPGIKLVSAMTIAKSAKKGHKVYLCVVKDTQGEPSLEDIPVVREFPDVFPKEIPGMPPPREVEFTIDLAPGIGPISKAPYRMETVELQELKEQLRELMEKGISDQVYHHGEHLFCLSRRKMDV